MGDSPGKKKKRKEEVRLQMGDREYFGPLKTSSIGEKFLEGMGIYSWPSITYEGPFKNSQIIGYGRCKWKDGRMHEGDFYCGKRHGMGVFISADGFFRYKGEWVAGLRHGQGIMVYGSEDEGWHQIQAELEEQERQEAATKASRTTRGGATQGGDNGAGTKTSTNMPDLGGISSGKSTTDKLKNSDVDGKSEGMKKIEFVGQDYYKPAFETSRYKSWYTGQWFEGKKHGEGVQQWRPGIVFQGQFKEGKITGYGVMTWSNEEFNEEYRGQWLNNQPHGTGVHTWHPIRTANTVKTHQLLDRHASQQCNNVYSGEWCHGLREGFGVFSYANGARYVGRWSKNTKEDPAGRYVFEDGSVYQGAFKKDRMVNYRMGKASNNTTLNIGGVDNPIRQCISIYDIRYLSIELESVVFNMLLRYLSEMKELYLRYRKVLQTSDDPFSLSSLQFWCMARDLMIVSPNSSLARLNRYLFKGKRYHSEINHKDFIVFQKIKKYFNLQENIIDTTKDTSGVSSSNSGTNNSGTNNSGTNSGTNTTNTTNNEESSSESGGVIKDITETLLVEAFVEELIEKEDGFYRPIGCTLKQTHDPSRILLFRHFMEGLVRIAPVRFPYNLGTTTAGGGLEYQLERLFKECIIPNMNYSTVSLELFQHFHDEELAYVLEPYYDKLLDIFITLNQGETNFGMGKYPNPLFTKKNDTLFNNTHHQAVDNDYHNQTINQTDDHITTSSHIENSQLNSQLVVSSGSEETDNINNKEGLVNINKSHNNTGIIVQGQQELLNTGVDINVRNNIIPGMHSKKYITYAEFTRGRIFSNCRRAHINARLDVTVRFKDILQMLSDLGMLKEEITLQKDVFSTIIPPLPEGDLQDLSDKMTSQRSRHSFMDLQRDKKQQVGESVAKWPTGFDTILGGGTEGSGGFNLNAAALLAKKKEEAGMAGGGAGGINISDQDHARAGMSSTGIGLEEDMQNTNGGGTRVRNQQIDIKELDWKLGLNTILESVLEMSAPKTVYDLHYFVPVQNDHHKSGVLVASHIPASSSGNRSGGDSSSVIQSGSQSGSGGLPTAANTGAANTTTGSFFSRSSPGPDSIGLLDYLETDLNFHEFVYILCELAYRGCIDDRGEYLLSVSRPKKVQAFLHYIFLPSFAKRYESPPKQEVEKKEEKPEDEEDEEEENKEEEEEKADDDGEEEEEEEKVVEEKELPPIEATIQTHSKALTYPRIIPSTYLQDIADW